MKCSERCNPTADKYSTWKHCRNYAQDCDGSLTPATQQSWLAPFRDLHSSPFSANKSPWVWPSPSQKINKLNIILQRFFLNKFALQTNPLSKHDRWESGGQWHSLQCRSKKSSLFGFLPFQDIARLVELVSGIVAFLHEVLRDLQKTQQTKNTLQRVRAATQPYQNPKQPVVRSAWPCNKACPKQSQAVTHTHTKRTAYLQLRFLLIVIMFDSSSKMRAPKPA